MDKPKVILCMPTGGELVSLGAARSFYCCGSHDTEITVRYCGGGSASNHNYNVFLALALEARDRGDATHFAMLHADVATSDDFWIDTLYRELTAEAGQFIAAVIPIKEAKPYDDVRTSTAVRGLATERELWSPRRYIMAHDRPTAVPEGFRLVISHTAKNLPSTGRDLVAIAGMGGRFRGVRIRIFNAAGDIEADLVGSDDVACPNALAALKAELRVLPEPITADAATARRIITAAIQVAGYNPPWTFGPEAVCGPDEVLLLNNGMCLLDLNAPGVTGYAFTCHNAIIQDPETGKYHARFRSEDWELSHRLQDAGARVLATWKVPVLHHGERPWTNFGTTHIG